MPDPNTTDNHLSWGDALFLYLEREGMPLHLAGVSMFEGLIPLEPCIDYVASKLPLIPRYFQRVVTPPLNLGLPSWEHDPSFDVRNHVHEIILKRGTEADFKAAAARVLSTTMDRQRPLWDLTLLQDLKGKRTAVVARVHHCLADGIAGVQLMNVLMDPKPVVHKRRRTKKEVFQGPPPRDERALLLDGLINTCAQVVQRALSAQLQLLNIAQQVVVGGNWPVTEFLKLLPEIATPMERLPFNMTTCYGPQKVAWGEIPLADVKAIKNAFGATVNDVALASVTAAVRRYSELHGINTKGRLLRMMVPVNMRNGTPVTADDLGNRISLLPVTIPLDINDPRKLVAAVHERMEFLKNAHVAELVGLVGTLVGITPAPFQAYAGPIASQLPISPFNLVCTNIPGPQLPLYLLGQKMLRWYPFVPIGGDMGVNCAILSYDNVVYFGFRGDVKAAPDLHRLEELLKLSFAELRKAAGLSEARSRQRRAGAAKSSPRRTHSRAATAAEPAPVAPEAKVEEPPPKAMAAAAAD